MLVCFETSDRSAYLDDTFWPLPEEPRLLSLRGTRIKQRILKMLAASQQPDIDRPRHVLAWYSSSISSSVRLFGKKRVIR